MTNLFSTELFSMKWHGTILTAGDVCPMCHKQKLFAPPLGLMGLRCNGCGFAPGGGGQGEMNGCGAKAQELIDNHGDEAYNMAVKLTIAAVDIQDTKGAEVFAKAAKELMQAGYHKK